MLLLLKFGEDMFENDDDGNDDVMDVMEVMDVVVLLVRLWFLFVDSGVFVDVEVLGEVFVALRRARDLSAAAAAAEWFDVVVGDSVVRLCVVCEVVRVFVDV